MLFNFFSDEKIKKIPAFAGTALFGERDYSKPVNDPV